jgi:REP element-mobilizing transposase RayT
VAASFTACVKGRRSIFNDGGMVQELVASLRMACDLHACEVLVYCFMPDHLHAVLLGTSAEADTWKAFVHFKQKTGYWLKRRRSRISWQKDFYDHVLRAEEDLASHIRYIVENPVRKGLVRHWQDCPFTGSMGLNLTQTWASTQAEACAYQSSCGPTPRRTSEQPQALGLDLSTRAATGRPP